MFGDRVKFCEACLHVSFSHYGSAVFFFFFFFDFCGKQVSFWDYIFLICTFSCLIDEFLKILTKNESPTFFDGFFFYSKIFLF